MPTKESTGFTISRSSIPTASRWRERPCDKWPRALKPRNKDLQMPPKQKLGEAEISDIESWIKMGAPWPSGNEPGTSPKTPPFDLEKRRKEHWSWKPIQPGPLPTVKKATWPTAAVDHFTL